MSNTPQLTVIELLVILLIAAALILSGVGIYEGLQVSNEQIAKEIESQGYTNVQVLNKKYWFLLGCSNGDRIEIEFSATNSLSKQVNLTACHGGAPVIFPTKGLTIRS